MFSIKLFSSECFVFSIVYSSNISDNPKRNTIEPAGPYIPCVNVTNIDDASNRSTSNLKCLKLSNPLAK